MKYLIKYVLECYDLGLVRPNDLDPLPIDFSVTPFPSLDEARDYVSADYASVQKHFKKQHIEFDGVVREDPYDWWLRDDLNLEGELAFSEEGKAYCVSYRVNMNDLPAKRMSVDSVQEAPEDAEPSFRLDQEGNFIEGSFVADELRPRPVVDDKDEWDKDRDGFIEKVSQAVIAPFDGTESSPKEVIDWSRIGEYEVEGLKVLASRGDKDARYLLFEVAFDMGEDRPLLDVFSDPESYLIKAFENGCEQVVVPYMRFFFHLFSGVDDTYSGKVEWSREGGEVVDAWYYSYIMDLLDRFIVFCQRVAKDYPGHVDDCTAYLVKVAEWAEKKEKNEIYESVDYGAEERDGKKIWSAPIIYRYLRDFAERVDRLPESMRGSVKKALPEVFTKVKDPILRGHDLESIDDWHCHCDIDYLYERYGLEAVEKYVDGHYYDEYSEEQIEKYARLSPKLATHAQFCIWQKENDMDYGHFNEDLFRYCAIEKGFGSLPDRTFCYETMSTCIDEECDPDEEEGGFDEFMRFWQPAIFKKYGLEELTELGLKMFCDPSFDDFWYWIDEWLEIYPEFLDELIPILKEYEAKGSQDAVSVLEIINGLEEE